MESKSYEELYHRLNQIVEALQNEEIDIDNSIELFKEGIEIQKECRLILKNAEEKVTKILDENNEEHEFSEEI